MNLTYTQEEPKGTRCEERRRPVSCLRVAMTNGSAFNGWLVARSCRSVIRALDRSLRSKYVRHTGTKQLAKWEMRNEAKALASLA